MYTLVIKEPTTNQTASAFTSLHIHLFRKGKRFKYCEEPHFIRVCKFQVE